MTRRTVTLLLAAATLVGCEKSDEMKGSGPLSSGDADLFKHLPGGANAIFGGNYFKAESFMKNAGLDKVAEKMQGKGAAAWGECISSLNNLALAGTVTMKGKRGAEIRFAMSGATLKDFDECAAKAEYKHALSDDGNWLTVEIPGPNGKPVTGGYLKLKDGTLYSRQAFSGGASRGDVSVTTAAREDVEAEAANIKQSAMDDAKLADLATRVDRGKTIWFAGSAVDTPYADKVNEVYGFINLDSGLQLDVSVQVVDTALATKLEDGVEQAKKMSSALGGGIKTVLDELELKRKGDRVRVGIKLSNEQLKEVGKQLGGMGMGLGGMMRGGM